MRACRVYLDLVGTVGMERGLFAFVRSIPTCLCPMRTGQPTRTDNSSIDFCGGTVQLDSRAGVRSCGQRLLLTQRTAAHANISQGKPHRRRG